MVAATLPRVLPEFGLMPFPPGSPNAVPWVLWAVAFLAWLKVYWAYLSHPGISRSCGEAPVEMEVK